MAGIKKGDKVRIVCPQELQALIGQDFEVTELKDASTPFWELENLQTRHSYVIAMPIVMKIIND